jgi:hypothetical protein
MGVHAVVDQNTIFQLLALRVLLRMMRIEVQCFVTTP